MEIKELIVVVAISIVSLIVLVNLAWIVGWTLYLYLKDFINWAIKSKVGFQYVIDGVNYVKNKYTSSRLNNNTMLLTHCIQLIQFYEKKISETVDCREKDKYKTLKSREEENLKNLTISREKHLKKLQRR